MHVDQASVFTDLAGLQKIKQMPKGESDEDLKAVAKQFESIFVNMMLKTMRDANKAFESDDMTSSKESRFYRDMMDNQLAVSLSSGKGIGLADVLLRQLKESAGHQTPSDVLPAQNLDQSRLQQTIPSQKVNAQQNVPQSFDTPEDFVSYIYPLAEKVSAKLDVDPKYIVSQAALETGWGKHMIRSEDGTNSFNLFGIKSDERWSGDVARVPTLEYRNGVAAKEHANFRAYQSYEDSLDDYVNFVSGQARYQDALNKAAEGNANSGAEYMQALQSAGYATDPFYARKVNAIAEQPLLAALGGEK